MIHLIVQASKNLISKTKYKKKKEWFLPLPKFKHMKTLKCINQEQKDHQIF